MQLLCLNLLLSGIYILYSVKNYPVKFGIQHIPNVFVVYLFSIIHLFPYSYYTIRWSFLRQSIHTCRKGQFHIYFNN